MRICTGCRKKLPESSYYIDKRPGRNRPKCKQCMNAVHKKYRNADYLRELYYNVRNRCKNNSLYIRKGISFHFKTLVQFKQVLGPRPSEFHTIDRIDNDGHYEPGNVRWATFKEQANNRSTNVNMKTLKMVKEYYLKHNISIRKVCKQFGLDRQTFSRKFPTLYVDKQRYHFSDLSY